MQTIDTTHTVPKVILKHIKRTINPTALILYGTRGREQATADSDWDFISLGHNQNEEIRIVLEGHDVFIWKLPNDNLSDHLIRCIGGGAKIIIDDANQSAESLMKRAQKIWHFGFPLSDERKLEILTFIKKYRIKLQNFSPNSPEYVWAFSCLMNKIARDWFTSQGRFYRLGKNGFDTIRSEDPDFSNLYLEAFKADPLERLKVIDLLLESIKLKTEKPFVPPIEKFN